MKCAKCGNNTIDEEGLTADHHSVSVKMTLDHVPIRAYVCYTCGHIELSANLERFREYRLKYVTDSVHEFILRSEDWTHPPIPKTFEITLVDLADELNMELVKLKDMMDDVLKWINVPENFWKCIGAHVIGTQDRHGKIVFKLEGSGKNLKLVAVDKRHREEPHPNRF